MTTTLGHHKSYEENLEVHRWRVRYIDNKIGRTQATLLPLIYLISGDNNFTTFAQVLLSMYADLFGITQYPSGNTYLVTKLLHLSLGCNFVTFDINITGPFTPAALPTQRTIIENLK